MAEQQKRRGRPMKKQVDAVTENLEYQNDEFEIPAYGNIEVEEKRIEPVDSPMDSEYAQQLAFMEEQVTIQLHDPQDNNPEPIVPVGVNGKVLYLRRGQQHTLPRKYIEVLARARRVNYRTEEGRAADGSMTTILKATTTMQYPFTVIHDPSGDKGIEWLKRIMSEKV